MKRSLVIHPFLFALFPVLSLFSHNMEELSARVMVAPAVVVLVAALLSWLVLRLLLKDAKRAGLVVSLGIVLFFSYGHFSGFAGGLPGVASGVLRHRLLLPLWVGLFALGSYYSWRTRRSLTGLTSFLNVVAAVAVAIPLAGVVTYEVRTGMARNEGRASGSETMTITQTGESPHIYYIILDEYGGQDILEEICGFDNGPFLDSLSQRGFYVARKSRANYHYTHLSLASSLNSQYLTRTDDWKHRIQQSRVISALRDAGYTTVAFSSEISYSDLSNADVRIGPLWAFNEFQNQLMNTTPLLILEPRLLGSAELHRRHILYTLDHLSEPCRSDEPVFVFAHILCPHPPFVFEEDGSPARAARFLKFNDARWAVRDSNIVREYIEGYRRQIAFLNGRLLAIIDDIFSASSRPCVIILQADHGPRTRLYPEDIDRSDLKERFSILNAYYLPDTDYSHLREEISPVNTFRVVFNRYFGTEQELLEDRNYVTRTDRPGRLFDVTDETVDSPTPAVH